MALNVGHSNRLLAALPADDLERLLPLLEPVTLNVKSVLYEQEKPIDYVYFITDGVASMLAVMEDGTLVEVGTVGKEGMIGLPVFLGSDRTSGTSFQQIPGHALRMKASDLRAEVQRGSALVSILQRYVQALFVMLAQHTACNRIHFIEQRCARWLLMCRDRVDNDRFTLTQEFLAQMLGVRRAGVNEVMQKFQDAGYINYWQGTITILQRTGLESIVCECYGIIKHEYDRMLEQIP